MDIIPDTIEKCVSCGEDTPYRLNENIFNRYHYVEGAGQLCETCYNRIY
jgi:hypothetical protein